MSKLNTAKRIKLASIKARNRVNIRWNRLRAEQAIADAKAPSLFAEIIRRVIVIDRESVAREATIYSTDTYRDQRRKLRNLLAK